MATPYNGFDLPVIGADADTWGGKLNTIMESIDTLLSSPANTIKGNNTGSQVATLNLTGAQVTAMLSNVVGDSGSGGTKGLVPAAPAGSAAKGQYLRANGSFGNEVEAWGVFNGSTGAFIRGRNMSGVRNSAGTYTLTFTTAISNANYAAQVSYKDASLWLAGRIQGKSTTNVGVKFLNLADASAPDPEEFYIEVRV